MISFILMRTTLDLPHQFTKEVQLAFPSKTKKGSFMQAMRKGLQSKAYDGLAKMGGAFPTFTINLDRLRGRNRSQHRL